MLTNNECHALAAPEEAVERRGVRQRAQGVLQTCMVNRLSE